jgi:hypothetical protein
MSLLLVKISAGMLVGTLVGLTGLGGGAALLPILILVLGVPPIVAVGSAAAFNALTKIGAGFMHWRQRSVDWRLVSSLAVGSVPGSFCGITVLAHLRSLYGDGVNDILRTAIGVLLICIPVLYVAQRFLARGLSHLSRPQRLPYVAISLIGLAGGFLVGMSSVGSGSIIMIFLMIFVRVSPAILVGTNIVHAIVLTGFTSLLHLRLGTVDSTLVLPLLVGSLPGSVLGAQLSHRFPSRWLQGALYIVLFVTGAGMSLGILK